MATEHTGSEIVEATGGPMEMADAREATRQGPNWFITLLWFVFVGSWLSALWSIVAWALMVSVIGLPLGLIMLNRLPQIATLRPPLRLRDGARVPQLFWLWRAAYFLLVGWWLSFIWMTLAWTASATLVGIPLGIYLWNRVPAVTTLARY